MRMRKLFAEMYGGKTLELADEFCDVKAEVVAEIPKKPFEIEARMSGGRLPEPLTAQLSLLEEDWVETVSIFKNLDVLRRAVEKGLRGRYWE